MSDKLDTRNVKVSTAQLNLQWITLVLAVVIVLVKVGAFWLTSSNAILTDALEGLVNVLAGGIGLYAIYLARLPRDENHPYGHGKVEFISSGIEGGLILLAGVVMVLRALVGFVEPTQITQVDVGAVIIAFTGLVNFIWGYFLVKRGKQIRSLVIESSGEHLKSDAYTTVGLLFGLILLWVFPLSWIDNVLAIGFGLFIVRNGYRIIRKSLAGIMDEADQQLIEELITHLDQNRSDNWMDIHNLRVVKYGTQLHIDAHLTVPWYFEVKAMHDEVEKLNEVVNEKCGSKVEMFVHVDPCIADSCAICTLSDCQHRQQPFQKTLSWKWENITRNQKHHLSAIQPQTNQQTIEPD